MVYNISPAICGGSAVVFSCGMERVLIVIYLALVVNMRAVRPLGAG